MQNKSTISIKTLDKYRQLAVINNMSNEQHITNGVTMTKFDRTKVKEVMGTRYPLVYVVYVANGPMLLLFGLLLVMWPRF